jgi:hypothetical protein
LIKVATPFGEVKMRRADLVTMLANNTNAAVLSGLACAMVVHGWGLSVLEPTALDEDIQEFKSAHQQLVLACDALRAAAAPRVAEIDALEDVIATFSATAAHEALGGAGIPCTADGMLAAITYELLSAIIMPEGENTLRAAACVYPIRDLAMETCASASPGRTPPAPLLLQYDPTLPCTSNRPAPTATAATPPDAEEAATNAADDAAPAAAAVLASAAAALGFVLAAFIRLGAAPGGP